jgi:hypothetical protein
MKVLSAGGLHTSFIIPVAVTVASSRLFKRDITSMSDLSDRLRELRPVTYHYKEGYGDGGKQLQYGLIAEEVAEVFPEIVEINDEGVVEGVRYGMLTPMLLSELQEKNAEIAELQEANADLQNRIALLEGLAGRLASIEKQLGIPAAAGEEQK